jgi:hypothetical protein
MQKPFGYFQVLATVNKIATNIFVWAFICIYIFDLFG